MSKNTQLPPLPFGEKSAKISTDISKYSSTIANVITSLEYYDIADNAKNFMSKTSALYFNDFKIIANANTPVTIKVADTQDITLMIPLYGENISEANGKMYNWRAKEHAVLLASTSRGGRCSDRVNLTIDINKAKLFSMSKTMLGEDVDIDFRLDESRLVPLTYGNISFDDAIKKLCLFIDAYDGNVDLLSKLNIEELFYRNIVMMLAPEKFFGISLKQSHSQSSYKSIIYALITASEGNCELFNNITDLEKFTGLSARSLQYAFKTVLHTTPSVWLRNLKLDIARHKIINNINNQTISMIALSIGFSDFSWFAKYYKERFGELPSQTKQHLR